MAEKVKNERKASFTVFIISAKCGSEPHHSSTQEECHEAGGMP